MDDVIVRDVVEEETTLPAEERPVDGSSSSALEVPFFSAVMRHDGVGMVEVSDHDDWRGKETEMRG